MSSEKAAGRTLRPRDAATLIVVDRDGPEPKVLMGRRHAGHAFMPGKFVFPGGRVEPEDRRMAAAGALDPFVEAKLNVRVPRPSPGFARAIALAAIRETFEETGLAIGVADYGAPEDTPPGVWTPLAKARELDLPNITAMALDDLALALETGLDRRRPRPFYRELRGKRLREEL